jgi:glycosyltransferase involved in cell wall biosynthesis
VSAPVPPAARARVTTVITFFDSERYLAEAVESALAQTYPSIELILVDDGSSDRSSEIARSYSPPARYVRRDNGGPAAARNTGLAHASGDFVAFLDSDNRWLPGGTELQLAAFAADPTVDVVFAQSREFVSAELDPATLPARGPRAGSTGVLVSSMLARRSVFETVGPFDERLRVGEWVDWYARLQDSACRVTVLPDVVVERRIHDTNNSIVRRGDRAEYARALKAALDRRRG